MPAEFSGAHHTPGNAVARFVQAAEGAFQAANVGQQVLFGNEGVVQHDLAGDRGTQRYFAFDFRGGEAFGTTLDDEAFDLVIVGSGLGPDHRDIGNRAVGDPHFRAGQAVATIDFFRTGDHGARIGAMVGFGQAEAAHHLAAGKLGQVFLFLLFGAIRFDGVHYQR